MMLEPRAEAPNRGPGRRMLGSFLVTVLICSGCSSEGSSAAAVDQQQRPAATAEVPSVLATIGDQSITLREVRVAVGGDLDRLDAEYARARHRLIETTLRQILRDTLFDAEARKQGKSVDELIRAEAGGALEPSDAEISSWYDENQDRVGGRSLDQVHGAIAEFLRKQRQELAMQKLEQRLEREHNVTVNLGPYRIDFDNADAPSRGPAEARVTLVEFSDFQCPFCGRFFSTLARVEKNFGDTVRVVYRQFPLSSIHPNAQKAAEASLCAKEQGKFWQMHDLMFQDQAHLGIVDLKEKAGRLGLNQRRFDECLDSGRYAEWIEKDLQEGQRAGVTGTPALFINGIPLRPGALPYEAVADAIHEELQRGIR